MPVSVSIPGTGQQVVVHAGPVLKSLGTKELILNGSEQLLCEQPGGSPSEVMGYVDLGNLVAGDTVLMKFYVKLKSNGGWRACYEESYTGVQALPLVHVAKRPENHGIMVTLQQTAGSSKIIEYEFFEES